MFETISILHHFILKLLKSQYGKVIKMLEYNHLSLGSSFCSVKEVTVYLEVVIYINLFPRLWLWGWTVETSVGAKAEFLQSFFLSKAS